MQELEEAEEANRQQVGKILKHCSHFQKSLVKWSETIGPWFGSSRVAVVVPTSEENAGLQEQGTDGVLIGRKFGLRQGCCRKKKETNDLETLETAILERTRSVDRKRV